MNNRFELSLKNKEVRMWIYLAIPTFIIGIIIIYYGRQNYQYIPYSMFMLTYYIWRYVHRKKLKRDGEESS